MITVKKTTKPVGVKYADLVVGNLYTFTYSNFSTEKRSNDGFIYLVGMNTDTGKKVAVVLEKFGNCDDKAGNVFQLSSDQEGSDTLFTGEVTIKNT
jgi:transglutaminase-like putative cysteine protease